MKPFYLYGGGINALSVCDFFERKNIKGVIDRDTALQGQKIRNIPIISLDDFRNEEHGEKLLIAAYDAQKPIIKDFDEKGIKNYYRSPWMQSEFFKNREDVITFHKLESFNCVIFYRDDPVSEYITERLANRGRKTEYFRDGAHYETGCPIVVCTNEDADTIELLKQQYPENEIIVLNNTKREDSYDYSVLRKFKDIHKGKRCFLVGNGPSVTYEDLDCLRRNKEICFGVNAGYRAFENTKWRPDYYVAIDQYFIEDHIAEINSLECVKFFRHLEYSDVRAEGEAYDVHLIPGVVSNHNFSFDIEKGVYSGDTVLYDALQIASYMGFSEIYLIGADMSVGVAGNSQANHFYKAEKKVQIPVGVWDPTTAIEAFGAAHDVLKQQGIRFENATRNAWWDNVPRVEFDSLMK